MATTTNTAFPPPFEFDADWWEQRFINNQKRIISEACPAFFYGMTGNKVIFDLEDYKVTFEKVNKITISNGDEVTLKGGR